MEKLLEGTDRVIEFKCEKTHLLYFKKGRFISRRELYRGVKK